MHTTPLNAWHHSHNGRMVDFAGWEMPVQYSSIVEEHNAVRNAVGLFDISHMGRLQFRGDSSEAFLNGVLTNDTSKLKVGDVRYSLVCGKDGGILDDVLIYRFLDRWELVVNASNREKIVSWLKHCAGFAAVEFTDITLSTGMIAVQGSKALTLVNEAIGTDLSGMKYYTAKDAEFLGTSGVISRTGYTGEDGFELVMPSANAERVWQTLFEFGAKHGIIAAGLGCRDTLRLEAAMPLYGHELNETIDPLTAGLQFAVKFNKPEYPGKAALELIKSQGVKMARVGLVLEGRRIAREESAIQINGQDVGKVTSGTFSPTLQKVIAMAYVPVESASPGTAVDVNLRGTLVPAKIVPLPFYKRNV
ncbi:MAG TPA: glycine cleavage system aminomethyltransferase GcvT [Planctomycetaceae bacterium]|nr:glycine cleavage system aminomethyltransferase GcvT [Planctomycetaceae bacterium]